jgi:hypothetical protein
MRRGLLERLVRRAFDAEKLLPPRLRQGAVPGQEQRHLIINKSKRMSSPRLLSWLVMSMGNEY